MSSKYARYADGFHFLPTPACFRVRFCVSNFTIFTNRDSGVSIGLKITTRRFVHPPPPNRCFYFRHCICRSAASFAYSHTYLPSPQLEHCSPLNSFCEILLNAIRYIWGFIAKSLALEVAVGMRNQIYGRIETIRLLCKSAILKDIASSECLN